VDARLTAHLVERIAGQVDGHDLRAATPELRPFDGQIGQTSYSASKAGVHGITLVAARDLASWATRRTTRTWR